MMASVQQAWGAVQQQLGWVTALLSPRSLVELVVLGLCLGLAWLVARALRPAEVPRGSIWFGERIIDGVLWPALALAAAAAAQGLMKWLFPVAVLRLAVPILLSLLVIRIAV
ncbi:MAG: hypothetical protein ACK58U_17895, partial [Rubrivivax sp.]